MVEDALKPEELKFCTLHLDEEKSVQSIEINSLTELAETLNRMIACPATASILSYLKDGQYIKNIDEVSVAPLALPCADTFVISCTYNGKNEFLIVEVIEGLDVATFHLNGLLYVIKIWPDNDFHEMMNWSKHSRTISLVDED